MSKELQRTRALLGAADPAAGTPPRPPRLSAAELIAHAERTPPPRIGRAPFPKRRLAVAAGLTVLAAGATAVLQPFGSVTLDRPGSPAPPVAAPPAPGAAGPVLTPIAYQYSADAPAAGPRLRALAARVGAAPYDTATGRYAYHRLRGWGSPSMTSPEGYVLGYCDDVRQWQAPDGSGVMVTTPLPPQFPDQASRDYWRKHLPPVPGPSRTELPPDPNQHGVPTDRAGMAAALDAAYDPGAVTKRIDKLYSEQVVTRAGRALALSVLADVPGFVWRGAVTDQAGRRGVAISYDDTAEHQQFLLVFDAHTGALLASEAVVVAEHRVASYQMVLDTGRTDRTG